MKENETRRLTGVLCRRLFGRAPDSVTLCTVGMVNTVYIAELGGERYVVRLNGENGVYSESARLLGKAGELGLPVPRVIGSGCEEGYEYIVISFIPGKDLGLVYHELTRENKRDIAAGLVKIQQLAAGLPERERGGRWYDRKE